MQIQIGHLSYLLPYSVATESVGEIDVEDIFKGLPVAIERVR